MFPNDPKRTKLKRHIIQPVFYAVHPSATMVTKKDIFTLNKINEACGIKHFFFESTWHQPGLLPFTFCCVCSLDHSQIPKFPFIQDSNIRLEVQERNPRFLGKANSPAPSHVQWRESQRIPSNPFIIFFFFWQNYSNI